MPPPSSESRTEQFERVPRPCLSSQHAAVAAEQLGCSSIQSYLTLRPFCASSVRSHAASFFLALHLTAPLGLEKMQQRQQQGGHRFKK